MNEQELYRQKRQAQLNEWKAELDKLKAKASGASADTQLKMKEQVEMLGQKIEEGKQKLAELSDAGDAAWKDAKTKVDATWESLKSSFREAGVEVNA